MTCCLTLQDFFLQIFGEMLNIQGPEPGLGMSQTVQVRLAITPLS